MIYSIIEYGQTIFGGVKMNKGKKQPEEIITDPFGSYTGRPLEVGEHPIQDADDL